MTSRAELVLLLTAKDQNASKAVKDLNREATGLGKTLSTVGKIGAGFVLGAGLAQAPGILKGFANATSDLNESTSKSTAIFKENAGEIDRWATGAARSFGQSKQQAMESAATFGNMFQQLGIGGDVATDMSKTMTELASDFASFHNADITDVLVAQTAAFRGEYDAVQRFVPTINAAAVEQKALAMTSKESTKELTLQEKALATYTLMMEGAGEAVGDFDRTAQGAANSERIRAAEEANLAATLGTLVLPVQQQITRFLTDEAIPAGQAVTQFLKDNEVAAYGLGVALVVLLAAMAPIPVSIGAIIIAGTLLINHWDELIARGERLLGVFHRLSEFAESPIGNPLGGAFGGLPSGPGGLGQFGDLLRNMFRSVPGFASGTPYVPHDTLAVVHRGEAIIPASQNHGMGGITVNVYGSILAERDIERIIRDAITQGGFRGLIGAA